ncbi:transcriptional repressor BetI [Providencia rustigianii]|uniref:Transcriptional repressor BetI n=1 Tax=Providencia rustigianii TaxID=158850 RepID=A0A379G5Z1_9GAMM|nr:TetR/AcrR family transcriptional regulator [Providencia rustigianii]SUC36388.1 transcriptional repressor BetI [Providencia rustigianii]
MSKSEYIKPARGRPSISEDILKMKMIQATSESLIKDGYQLTTIDNVAKRAGVAKKTIYRFVDNRDDLIEQVVLSWTDSFVPLFDSKAHSTDTFFELLQVNLETIANTVLSEEAVGLYRLLQTDFKQKKILLDKYQKSGIERSRRLLADWLTFHWEQKIIKQNDYVVMSDLILSMAIAEPLRQISLGLAPAGISTELKNRIQQIIILCRSVM